MSQWRQEEEREQEERERENRVEGESPEWRKTCVFELI
jgi:hypothetical protein